MREGAGEVDVDADAEREGATFGERLRAGRDREREDEEDSDWGERRVELTEKEGECRAPPVFVFFYLARGVLESAR